MKAISAIIWPIIFLLVILALILYVLIHLWGIPQRDFPDQSPPPPIVQTNGWIVPCIYCDQNSDQ